MLRDHKSSCLPIREESDVGAARRLATEAAVRLGLDETECGKIAIIVTEATRNMLRHGGCGEVVLRALADADGSVGLECLALDKGPGIGDISAALLDGFS